MVASEIAVHICLRTDPGKMLTLLQDAVSCQGGVDWVQQLPQLRIYQSPVPRPCLA